MQLRTSGQRLSDQTYLKRFQEARIAIGRSSSILILGILAFWFATEFSLINANDAIKKRLEVGDARKDATNIERRAEARDQRSKIPTTVGSDEGVSAEPRSSARSTVESSHEVTRAGYDLRLRLVDGADGLLNEGRNLVIVALVGTELHIRIFDANGKRVVDKAENELISGETLKALKKQLNPLPNESGLSQEQKQKLIQDATSIAGHTLPDPTTTVLQELLVYLRDRDDFEKRERALALRTNDLKEVQQKAESSDREFETTRKEAINFTFLGISLPARISFAPLLTLAILLGWLLWMEQKRQQAHWSLAAFILAYRSTGQFDPSDPTDVTAGAVNQLDRPPFGSAGEPLIWLSPWPARITVPLDVGLAPTVARADLLHVLGVVDESAGHSLPLLRLIIIAIGLFAARVVWVAFQVLSPDAVDAGLVPVWWAIIGFVMTAAVAALVFQRLWIWAGPARLSPREWPSMLQRWIASFRAGSSFTPARREALVFGSVATALVLLSVARFDAVLRRLASVLPFDEGEIRAAITRRGREPRFLTKLVKQKRLQNFRVFVLAEQGASFLGRFSLTDRRHANRERPATALHYAASDRRVRFFSAAPDLNLARATDTTPKGVEPLVEQKTELDDSWRWISQTHASDAEWLAGQNIKPVRTWQWEAAALDRIEAGQMEAACDLLFAGIKLDLRAITETELKIPKKRPNLRLYDLLAGLAVRYQKELYLEELCTLIDGLRGGQKELVDRRLSSLEKRISKWRNPNGSWRKRWANPEKPVWWHHPMQIRAFPWTRTSRMRRPPPNPELRQRPFRIP